MTDTINPDALRIESGHLIEDIYHCTCSGINVGFGFPHEPGCGRWPLMTVGELAGLISGPEPEGVGEVTASGLTVYGRIANPDGTELRVQQSAIDGCARIYGVVHGDGDGARKLRKALDAFIHDATFVRDATRA